MFFLEWLKNEMHEEAYDRLVRKADRREMAMRAKNAGVNVGSGPGWIYSEPVVENKEGPAVQFSVADQMYTLANSFVDSFDEMWQSYVNGIQEVEGKAEVNTNTERVSEATGTERVSESTGTKKRPHLWELAQAEGDDAWLEWINDHIWTYIGLSAPLLGAINPLRAVLSGENMGLPMAEKSARDMTICT